MAKKANVLRAKPKAKRPIVTDRTDELPSGPFCVVLARYMSRHKTAKEASEHMRTLVREKPDDLHFIMELPK